MIIVLFGEKCVSETSARAYTQGNLKPSLISWHGLSIKQNSATCRYDKLVINDIRLTVLNMHGWDPYILFHQYLCAISKV